MSDWVVYAIVNLTTDKRYIGSTCRPVIRQKEHWRMLSQGNHHSQYLQNSWNKHGANSFVFVILEVCERDKTALLLREQFYIDTICPEYNHCPTAGSRLGSRASDETRLKMSVAMKGKYLGRRLSEETRAKIKAAAANPSEQARARMSAAKAGGILAIEHRSKIASSLTGRPKTVSAREKTKARKAEKKFIEVIAITENLKGKIIRKNDVRRMLRSLTDEQVKEIRSSPETSKTLSERYPCSVTTIQNIRRGRIYRDVT
ncbi:MAG: hypothetical protein EOO38_13405 [Cytophagaceae bacterium]|nr:MAG: hypothetical protein EOO38_13405 [Cytophagaceae bacterium]